MSPSFSFISSHGLALATAVAVSGTVILIALYWRKSISMSTDAALPSSAGDRNKKQQRRKKRVRFAEEVAGFDATSRREENSAGRGRRRRAATAVAEECRRMEMPGNREALYRGILRERMMHRMACYY
ncbi:uncharacterized protein LOC141812085 [Curcuma longa]|uniref:uncharacterized protein LOC141812085 n=1 Tax=Curcuma longa TaxID=136217 RepID=UPI003D9E84C4